MSTNLTQLIRALGHKHGMSNILSITTPSQTQISLQRGQRQDTLRFLTELGQLLHTQGYEVTSVRDDYPHLTIIAQAVKVSRP